MGNYIGALKPLIEMSQNHKTFMFIADLHALNSVHDAKEIKQQEITGTLTEKTHDRKYLKAVEEIAGAVMRYGTGA